MKKLLAFCAFGLIGYVMVGCGPDAVEAPKEPAPETQTKVVDQKAGGSGTGDRGMPPATKAPPMDDLMAPK